MRTVWTSIGEGFYKTVGEARAAARLAVAPREVLRGTARIIPHPSGGFLLEGHVVVGPWGLSVSHGGGLRDVLVGNPVKSPLPVTRKSAKGRRR